MKGNYLHYFGLIASLPKHWKGCINENQGDWQTLKTDTDPSLTSQLLNTAKPAKYLYSLLINNRNDQPFDRADKWAIDIEEEVLDFEWYDVLYESYLCTKSIELRSFIYRFAMRDLYPNSRLYKMKLVDDPHCPKCKTGEETIIHMFWTCDTVKNLWKQTIDWLNEEFDINIKLQPKTLLLHYIECDITFLPALTMIFTLVKRTIYQNKESSNQIHINHIKTWFRNMSK